MERKDFIKKGILGTIVSFVAGSFGNKVNAAYKLVNSRYRGVEGVLSPTNTHMVGNGFKVMNFFPNGKGFEERMSPFFLLDFNAEVNFPPSDISQGVGVHPHRGIETITFAYKGGVEHHDSKGNHGIIGKGNIQWMTAGGGVLHKEYHEKNFNKNGGAFEMVQLWINLPKAHKMTPAKYQSIAHNSKPKHTLPNNMGVIHVVAGEYSGVKGIASTFSPIHMYDMHLNDNADFTFTLPGNYNTGILVVDGSIIINNTAAPENHYVQLKNENGDIHIKANAKTTLLLLSGEPLNEPFVGYGPFVMNTEAEIHQAIEDYNQGKFGFLKD
ncbi:short-chain dehydrogenase [Flavipsychrobacter stenotrophus]|uniref:Short-chain dehydrogenase n=1 Tax=Flavipsychrobacter stenotrophus TaxID=2077091 RepID=A0A2S7ST40_9BACT|nr:pirin family protein [Flavipsychrobacter stenotrophus]PQJ09868.1 short-chain dehydrogenase [Flavipsychrobacter stenotrophus]